MHRAPVLLRLPFESSLRRPVWQRVVAGGLVGLTILALPACGASRQSPSQGTANANATTPPLADRNAVITAEELARMVGVSNAYEAVMRARPLWLQSRGIRSKNLPTEIAVGVNGRYFGPALTTLSTFELQAVKELRYMDAAEATAFLGGIGARQVESAIIVVLR